MYPVVAIVRGGGVHPESPTDWTANDSYRAYVRRRQVARVHRPQFNPVRRIVSVWACG